MEVYNLLIIENKTIPLSHHQEPNRVPTESYTPRWWN
jgi:hypothetical protein